MSKQIQTSHRYCYHYPYEVAVSPLSRSRGVAILKRGVPVEDRPRAIDYGYACCECNAAWPGCPCPETPEEYQSRPQWVGPGGQKYLDRRAKFIAQGGDPCSLTAFSAWEAMQREGERA